MNATNQLSKSVVMVIGCNSHFISLCTYFDGMFHCTTTDVMAIFSNQLFACGCEMLVAVNPI